MACYDLRVNRREWREPNGFSNVVLRIFDRQLMVAERLWGVCRE